MILLKIAQTFFPPFTPAINAETRPPARRCGKNGRPITFKAFRHLDELAGKQGTTNPPKDYELYLCYKT